MPRHILLPKKLVFDLDKLVSSSVPRWLWMCQACVIISGLGQVKGFNGIGLVYLILFHNIIIVNLQQFTPLSLVLIDQRSIKDTHVTRNVKRM